jgi:hypothetical protein
VVASIAAMIGSAAQDLSVSPHRIRPTAVETLWFRADALPDVVMRTTGPIKEDP